MADTSRPTGFSLRRWSQRKLAAGRRDDPSGSQHRAPAAPAAKPDGEAARAPLAGANAEHERAHAPVAGAGAEQGRSRAHPMAADASTAAPAIAGNAVALPPLESLTIDSDFSPFMRPGVDEDLKRSALRRLLRDPQFNVMDGLDVYIDDYSKPSPLEPELARALMQARYIFDPPQTRVTPAGIVEDVPQGADAVAGRDHDAAGNAVAAGGSDAAGNAGAACGSDAAGDAVAAGDREPAEALPPSAPVALEVSGDARLPGAGATAGADAPLRGTCATARADAPLPGTCATARADAPLPGASAIAGAEAALSAASSAANDR